MAQLLSHFKPQKGSAIEGTQALYQQDRIEQAKAILELYILRRLKHQVLNQLPKKTEEVATINMEAEQADIYDYQLEETRRTLATTGQQIHNVTEFVLPSIIQKGSYNKRFWGQVLSLQLRRNEPLGGGSIPEKDHQVHDDRVQYVWHLRRLHYHDLLTPRACSFSILRWIVSTRVFPICKTIVEVVTSFIPPPFISPGLDYCLRGHLFITQDFREAIVYTTPIYNATRDPAIIVKIGSPTQTVYCNYLDVDYYGMIIIDGYNPSKSITAKNISVTSDQEFTIFRAKVGNKTINQAGYGALYLTDGTHNAPTAVLQALVAAGNLSWCPVHQQYCFPCSQTAKMPSLTFYIEGDPVELQWYDYMGHQPPLTADSSISGEQSNVFEKAFAKAVEEKRREQSQEMTEADSMQRSVSTAKPPRPTRPPRKYGFLFLYRLLCTRHLTICILMMACSLGGGYLFWLTEGPAEEQAMESSFASVEAKNMELSAKFVEIMKNNESAFRNASDIQDYIKNSYKSMLKEEALWTGSSFYKEQGADFMTWNFWSATFYASNIYMTVGYGSIQGFTSLTKVLTIIFGFISIPFSFVVIRDLSQWILVGCTKCYARFLINWRKDHGILTEPDEDISLPYKLTLVIWVVNWLAVSFLTWIYDSHNYEVDSGISYYGSMYFTYITLTSIGMSDEMPKNVTTSPLIAFWNVIGLPIYKMGFRILYIAMENGILGTLSVFKHKLAHLDGITDLDTAALEKYAPQKTSQQQQQQDVQHFAALNAEEEKDQIQEMVNNFTVRSIATFMKSHADAYGGGYGRVKVTRASMVGRGESRDE
ncbi:unnamed protein product, partial [Mesorhabditis belari]|uniref:Ion channel n=1 Tax=Mesorhabditis belari TaxID=2138241 RepID=A0AAF3FMI8_9BILA